MKSKSKKSRSKQMWLFILKCLCRTRKTACISQTSQKHQNLLAFSIYHIKLCIVLGCFHVCMNPYLIYSTKKVIRTTSLKYDTNIFPHIFLQFHSITQLCSLFFFFFFSEIFLVKIIKLFQPSLAFSSLFLSLRVLSVSH
jgi:hypothetical protein